MLKQIVSYSVENDGNTSRHGTPETHGFELVEPNDFELR